MINTRNPLNTNNMNISSHQGIPRDIAKTLITSIRPRTSLTGTLIPSPISKIRSTGLTIQLAIVMTQTTITILETKVTAIPHTIMTINHNTTTEM